MKIKVNLGVYELRLRSWGNYDVGTVKSLDYEHNMTT